ncbi:MAG TPA: ABC transporter substrate-binding protein [Candidatus Binatia bacterium]
MIVERRSGGNIFSLLVFLSCLLGPPAALAQSREKVFITATNAEDVTSTLFLYGIEKGLFRGEGIDLEFRLLPPNLALAALVAKEIDYASTVGSPFRAAVRGFPVKVVAVGLDKPLFYIMAQPAIQSVKDLKGAKFAVSSLQGSGARSARAGLQTLGLHPDKDLTFIVIGNSATRMLAMETGSVQATVVPAPDNFRLREKGFREMMFTGRYITEPFVGIAATREKVEASPGQVKKVTKGFLRSLGAAKRERKEMIEFLMRRFKFKQENAVEIYETLLQSFTRDGTVEPAALKEYLDLIKAEARVQKEIAVSDIVDFRLLREAARELER